MKGLLEENNIIFSSSSLIKLNEFIHQNKYSKIFVIVDDNTKIYCLEYFSNKVSFNFQPIIIPKGEEHKHVKTCLKIWEELSDKGADRKSLVINLGGGVVTDTGGFVASCYRRGINFVHIPTTLLAIVDAALGGKNGVDLNNLKNQIGVIKLPEKVIIDKSFLLTLPENEIRSGYAEMIKHGMIDISKSDYFDKCMAISGFDISELSELIEASILIKLRTVNEDINENGLRKILNYGHTLGHAIESYRMSLSKELHLLHGEAIAIGLVLESYISHKIFDFPMNRLKLLKDFVRKHYRLQQFGREEQKKIVELMKYDKKNEKEQVNFVLLEDVGKPHLDCQVKEQLIFEAFEFYRS
jgi:3-dehydroquinate synthase